jgi:hypothetical protein
MARTELAARANHSRVRLALRAALALITAATLATRARAHAAPPAHATAQPSQAATPAATPPSDAHAIAIANQVMDALGGETRWSQLHGLRWAFEVSVHDTIKSSRHHSWDKQAGWHRVEGVTRAGKKFLFIEQLGTGHGMAWMEGKPITGDSLSKLVAYAKSMWTNDTYWMLMPYKLRDPGVTLRDAGEKREGTKTYDKIALSFNHVGETPGDHYWIYVNRANHRIEKWDMILEGDKPPAQSWTWDDWTQKDGLWFPTAHRQGNVTIYTRGVETVSAFRPGEFSAP